MEDLTVVGEGKQSQGPRELLADRRILFTSVDIMKTITNDSEQILSRMNNPKKVVKHRRLLADLRLSLIKL